MPWDSSSGKVSAASAIELCEKTYAHIAVFRNTIDIMTEFSSSSIYLTGGNKSSRTFVENWLRRIKVQRLTEQFFREYFRSGNVFLYRFDGKFSKEDLRKIRSEADSGRVSLAASKSRIALRYVILDPKNVVALSTSNFSHCKYVKVLSPYEIEQLRNPKTEEDQAVFDALSADAKKKIRGQGLTASGVEIELDPKRLCYVFYKKQPYEPFAIPFGFPVLKDIDRVEALKNMDQAISRTAQNVVLLITMGEKKHEYGGGVNPKAMASIQNIFSNESVTRVLVSDYTTKAQFAIPEIGNILDPKKYEVLERSIRYGLQNIIVGEERLANQMIKVKVFLERLSEGQEAFLQDFLQPEIRKVCKDMGFRKIPTAHFQGSSLKDEVQMMRIYTRLGEIGFLTPEQVFRAMETGILPEDAELDEAQDKYVKSRRKAHFNPVGSGTPMISSPTPPDTGNGNGKESGKPTSPNDGRPAGSSGIPQTTKKVSPQGTSSAKEGKYGVKKMADTVWAISRFSSEAEKAIKRKYKIKELTEQQEIMAASLVERVITTASKGKWSTELKKYLGDPEQLAFNLNSPISKAVEEIAQEHQTDYYTAALLYHSRHGKDS